MTDYLAARPRGELPRIPPALITEYAITDTRTVFYRQAPRLADYVFVSQAVMVEDFHVDQTPVSDHAALIFGVT
jgi:endonuclease/exonuclease/phosphatase family metal-dependent hydrolase